MNAQTGAVAQSIDYDANGRVLSETGAGFQPFGFAGGLYDAATGLVRFGARDYDPEIARWTNKDPIGFAGKQGNVYVYVGGAPIVRTDRHGLFGIVAGEELAGAFGPGFTVAHGGFVGFGTTASGEFIDTDITASALPQFGGGFFAGFYTGGPLGYLNTNGVEVDFPSGLNLTVLVGPDGWGVELGWGIGIPEFVSGNFTVILDPGPYSDLPSYFTSDDYPVYHCGG